MRHHQQKEDLLAQLAAQFINQTSNRQSLITVTRAILSSDEKRATILCSVLPEEKEKEVLTFLIRQLPEFRKFVKSQVKIRIIPFFTFGVDAGEKNRQIVDT